MSGIFGIFNKIGTPLEVNRLHCMQQTMAHWGADGNGIWCDRFVGLGHLLRHNTLESRHERQPYVHPAISDLVIVADSRIDNRDDLMEALCIPYQDRATLPDSQLILQAYECWGRTCVERLIGAFAFAIWDGRTRTLFCARDQVGFRPFCYYDGPRQFVFATDIKAILATEGVPQRLDELFVFAHYSNSKCYMRGRTAFLDIARLLPAHTLTVQDSQQEQVAYWLPGREPEIHLSSNDEYAEMLREQLQQAVDCRLRSIHPISSHLSGGLDSSIVTVLAARRLRTMDRELTCVHSWSPPPETAAKLRVDEYARIEEVCQQEGLTSNYVNLTPENIVDQHSRDISVEPTETLMCELIAQRYLRKQGVGIVLSGWGGDEIISSNGRGYLANLFLRGQWLRLLSEIRQLQQLQTQSLASVLKNRILIPILPDRLFSLLKLDIHPLLHLLIANTEVDWHDFKRQELDLLRQQSCCFRTRPGVRNNQLRELTLGYLESRMEAWANAGAQSGIEYRYPLLDQRLISLAFRFPPQLYFQQGWHRFIVRYATDDILPASVCWQKTKQDPALANAHLYTFVGY